jgi:hypothetical protein
MSMKNKKKKNRCWSGYKPTPGKTPYSKGSCVKESNSQTYRIRRLLERARWRRELASGPKLTIFGDELTKDMVKALLKNKKATMKNKKGEMVGPKGNIPAPRQDESRKGVMPKMKMGVHKSRAGGLTQKGVEAYRRANPGSKLKTAVTTKPSKLKKGSKSANRRKSFCARMGGMKKRLTGAKTASDPNSRINKALRKWNC